MSDEHLLQRGLFATNGNEEIRHIRIQHTHGVGQALN